MSLKGTFGAKPANNKEHLLKLNIEQQSREINLLRKVAVNNKVEYEALLAKYVSLYEQNVQLRHERDKHFQRETVASLNQIINETTHMHNDLFRKYGALCEQHNKLRRKHEKLVAKHKFLQKELEERPVVTHVRVLCNNDQQMDE